MKRQGGFIPGIRPGKPTTEYLSKILNYIVFIGAIGLIIVCVIPIVFNGIFGADVSFGGTSIIIIVGVVLERSLYGKYPSGSFVQAFFDTCPVMYNMEENGENYYEDYYVRRTGRR